MVSLKFFMFSIENDNFEGANTLLQNAKPLPWRSTLTLTEAEGVPSQGGRDDALLRRMLPYLT